MTYKKLTCLALLLVVCVVVPYGAATARTWRVEQNGTGDFVVIQYAIDAASSGDTIEIGPGRYTEFVWHTSGIIHYNQVISKSLTFVGAGVAQTIIGHESFGFPDGISGSGFIIMGDVGTTRFSHIGFDMPAIFGYGIYNDSGDRIEVENCRFTRCNSSGVFAIAPGGGFVRNCEFKDIDVDWEVTGCAVILYTPVNNFVVSDCVFENCFQGFGAFWNGCDGIIVENCEFIGGRTGAGFTDGASGTIRNCTFDGQDTRCVVANGFGTMVVENSTMIAVGVGPLAAGFEIWNGPGHAIVRNNVIISDMVCIRVLTHYVDLDIHGNHILQSGGQGLFARVGYLPYSGPPVHFDLSDNWWGTTDLDYIAEWIYDGHDDPTVNCFFDFEPIADGPVSVESRTWTEVKGLFRE